MGFTVKLNGSNYISEKTAAAFEAALQEYHPVTPSGNGGNGNGNGKNGNEGNGNGHGESHAYAAPVVHAPATAPAFAPAPAIAPAPNYTGMFDTLERGLAHSYDHQKQTLHVHEQYLHHQGEYARIFAQLMQQQSALFATGEGSPARLEAALQVLQGLARHVEQFHAHQTETLHVHNHFLTQQAEYTRAFIQLLQQQCDAALAGKGNGNGNGNGHHPTPSVAAPAPVVEAVAPSVTPSVTPVSALPPSLPLPPSPSLSPAPGLDVTGLTSALLAIVSEKTGYPAEMLELDMDMEADLGIDSIKRVEILGALQDAHPELPEIAADHLAELRTLAQIIDYMQQEGSASDSPAPSPPLPPSPSPAPAASLDVAALTQALLAIVSEKTGYPAEMLELDMDMEADLGIDSIKRVEILGALQDAHPDLPEIDADHLAELRTLAQIIDYMQQEGSASKKA